MASTDPPTAAVTTLLTALRVTTESSNSVVISMCFERASRFLFFDYALYLAGHAQ